MATKEAYLKVGKKGPYRYHKPAVVITQGIFRLQKTRKYWLVKENITTMSQKGYVNEKKKNIKPNYTFSC